MLEKTIQIDKDTIQKEWCYNVSYGAYKVNLYEKQEVRSEAFELLKSNNLKGYPCLNGIEYANNDNRISFIFGVIYETFFEGDYREKDEKEKDMHSNFIKITYEFSEEFIISMVKNNLKWEQCDDPYYGYSFSDDVDQFGVIVYFIKSDKYVEERDSMGMFSWEIKNNEKI